MWIHVLPDLVQNINQSFNRSIGLKPDDVNEDNEPLVFAKLYGHASVLKKPSFQVGDEVLLSKFASIFADQNKLFFKKGFKSSFTKENYVVSKVDRGSPNMYHLID